MPLTPEEMRALFPITRRYAYLDHAAIAPLATPVRSTMDVFLTRQSEEPFEREHWERLRGQVRNRVAALATVLSPLPVVSLCSGARTWLLGPIAAGFAPVGPRLLGGVPPGITGPDRVVRDVDFFVHDLTLNPDPRRFEEASPNYPGIL